MQFQGSGRLLGRCYATAKVFRMVFSILLCGSGWLLGCCYAVDKVFWSSNPAPAADFIGQLSHTVNCQEKLRLFHEVIWNTVQSTKISWMDQITTNSYLSGWVYNAILSLRLRCSLGLRTSICFSNQHCGLWEKKSELVWDKKLYKIRNVMWDWWGIGVLGDSLHWH